MVGAFFLSFANLEGELIIWHKTREKIGGENRERGIFKTSIIGIITNVFLGLVKALVGILAGSIALATDALNNLSDAVSSIITIVGTKLAGKRPTKDHSYGYGRIEYMTALIIGLIVLAAGLGAAKGPMIWSLITMVLTATLGLST